MFFQQYNKYYYFYYYLILLTSFYYIIIFASTEDSSWKKPELWESLPGTTFLKFYLFNITNPDSFEANEAKPALQQLGPYTFREKLEKFNIIHSDDGSSVSYSQKKYYDFIPSLSIDSESGRQLSQDDAVNIINIPFLTFAQNLAQVLYVGPNMFRSLYKGGERLIKRNIQVGDLFYYGYDAKIYLKIFDVLLPGEPIPAQFEGGRFGLFRDRNGTEEGPFELSTTTGSSSSSSEPGHLLTYKNEATLPWWKSYSVITNSSSYQNPCNQLNHSYPDGTVDLNSIDTQHYHLRIFVPDACRSLTYTYYNEVPIPAPTQEEPSLIGLKYKLDKKLLKSPTGDVSDQNFCYCPSASASNDFSGCYKSGVMDLGPCRNNSPLALTLPHFLDSDPFYLAQIQDGLLPNRTQHESYLIVEEKTGSILKDVKKFQLNLYIKPLKVFAYLKNVTEMLFPILWTEKVYELDSMSLGKLGDELNNPEFSTKRKEISWKVARRTENDDDDDDDGNMNDSKSSGSSSRNVHGSYNPPLNNNSNQNTINLTMFLILGVVVVVGLIVNL